MKEMPGKEVESVLGLPATICVQIHEFPELRLPRRDIVEPFRVSPCDRIAPEIRTILGGETVSMLLDTRPALGIPPPYLLVTAYF